MDMRLFVASLSVHERQELGELLSDFTQSWEEKALGLYLCGRKVDGIRLLKNNLQWDLKAAKDFLDSNGKVRPSYAQIPR